MADSGARTSEEECVSLDGCAGYAEMKRLASFLLQKQRIGTRRTTSLVHEAYLRMIAADDVPDYSARRLLAVAAHAMRSVLVDQARRRHAAKRGGGEIPLSLVDVRVAAALPDPALLRLNEALDRLHDVDERKARVVELRYFGGLTNKEASDILGVSTATIKREWAFARAWLFDDMTHD
ncbi:MAG TPA: ECF-type sigma factor [Phycisphaerae bacterium]|nr:ECF-type sigma factor [Phycisphaerae bacterium]HRW55427.1 ECF-type sigma factor [Phycisphaerae bacterium]